MLGDELIFAATSDLAGKIRGKAFPAGDREKREFRGVGWTPTNVQITCFDTIADSPFGSFGDLLLRPDASAEVRVDFEDNGPVEHFMLGDVLELNGDPWALCTRNCLRKALARLKAVAGVQLKAAFEHEFQLSSTVGNVGEAYGFRYFSAERQLGETLMAALRVAGLTADTFMKEYGPDQFEITVGPELDVRAADAAVIVRELTRISANRVGREASFTPIRDPANVGNGVHIHMSFVDDSGTAVTYAADTPTGLSQLAASFVAGILKYLDAIVAFTAPSVVSYQRLTPHRWSAAFNNLGVRDREAAVRVCPLVNFDTESVQSQFNFEFRAADAAASPYLALAALVHAGVQGIEERLPAPAANEDDLSLLNEDQLKSRGYVRLPQSLEQALQCLERSELATQWFGDQLVAVYLAHKRGEIEHVKAMTLEQQCALYGQTY